MDDYNPEFRRFSVFFRGSVFLFLLAFLLITVVSLPVVQAQELKSWDDIRGDNSLLEKYLSQLDENKELSRDSLQILLRSGYERFLQTAYKEGQAELLLRLGNLYSTENMFSAAVDAYRESLSLFTDLGNELKIAYSYAGLGTAVGRRGEYDEAADNLTSALQIFERLKDQTGIANTNLKLGTVYTYINELDLGLEYFQKALEIALIHDKHNVITIYGNIAFIYMEKGAFDKSEEYFKLAIDYTESPKSPRPRALAYLNLGQLYKMQGRTRLADQYFDKAAQLAEQGELREEMIAIALIRVDESSPESKARSLKELIALKEQAREFELNYMQFEILNKIIELSKSLHRHAETIGWMEERDMVEKKLFDERKDRDIANLRASYELEKSKKEIEDLNSQISSQRRIKTLTFIFSGFLILGFLIAINFYLRASRVNKLLEFREKELSDSVQVKDKLFSVIGHDLKNAISSQPIVLDLMRSGKDNEQEMNGLIDGLEASIHNVLYVLDTLLNWGKMQFKGVKVKPSLFDVFPLVENSVRLLRLQAQLKEIEIIQAVPRATMVFADQEQFKFVMRNLLSNAIKFSRKGGEINVGLHTSNESEVVFFVEDQGVGMDPDEMKTLFDPGRQSTPGTANETGTGIALMLSREFITKNSGRIWVESRKGQGSTFYFSLMAQEKNPQN